MTGIEQIRWWRKRLVRTSWVYVIQGKPGTPIKIGVAKDVAARIKGLQTGNPQKLRLLYVLPGGYELEADLHRRLRGSEVIGEWFDGPAVEGFLASMEEFTARARDIYEMTGTLPAALPKSKRLKRVGLVGYPYGRGGLPHRWRTSNGDDPAPVTVRYVEPNPKTPPEEARKKRGERQHMSAWELERIDR